MFKPIFIFLGCTVFEKNAMLTSSYYRTSLEYCATEKHQIRSIESIYISEYLNQISYSSVAQYSRKMRS